MTSFLLPDPQGDMENEYNSYLEGSDWSDAMDLLLQDEQDRPRKKVKKPTIDNQIRQQIISFCVEDKNPMSLKECSERLKVKYSTVCAICRDFRNNEIRTVKRRGGLKPALLQENDITCLENWLKEDCTLTNKELQELLHTHNEIDVSETTISRAVRGLHFTLKRVTERVDAAYSEAAKQARLAYSQWLIIETLPTLKESLIYYDECPFQVCSRRRYGRSRRGTKAVNRVPKRTRTITVMAAITSKGVLFFKILPNNGNTEEMYMFVSDLAAARDAAGLPTNSIVILDNVRFHHSTAVVQSIEECGFGLKFLPTYSPMFNPIEMVFAAWKAHVYNKRPTTEEELYAAIHDFTLSEEAAGNMILHAIKNSQQTLLGFEPLNMN